MTNQILSTKLFIPRLHANLVSRPRLIEQLNESRHRKLTLISAPAGFGKTTLLSEWIHKDENSFCWVSLDQHDNELGRFFAYIIASMQRIGIEVDKKVLSTLQSLQPRKLELLLIPLINQISKMDRRFSLVLDDYHLIQNQEIHEAVTYLLEYLPHNVHIVLTCRIDPPLRLAQWRARGEMYEIRAADLMFTQEEAICFLNQCMGLDLASSDVAVLNQKTEGWIVGLQLAALSIQHQSDKSSFITAFAGDHRHVADYLLDEVLHRQPFHIQTFLLQTSFLDQFCASLCDAVTARNDSQVILRELERSNLFLVPLDDQRNWYRYHHLFADLLRFRQRQEIGDAMAALYLRASSWYEEQQMLSEAVRLALMGDDTEKVAKLMEGHLLAIVSTSELSTLQQLLASLPESTVSSNPWLALAMAWGMAYLYQFESVEPFLEKAAASLRDLDEITRDRLSGRILVLKSYGAGTRRDYASSIQIARDALLHIPDDDLSMRSFTILIIGNAYRFEGDLKRAVEFHSDALSLSEEAGDIFLSVMILSRLIDIYKAMGQLNRAHVLGKQALEMIENHQKQTGVQSFNLGYLKLRLCGVYYERNELEMAMQCAETGLDLARQWGAYDSISLGYFNYAKIYQALGDFKQALNYLREFKETYPWEQRLQYKFASAIETELHLQSGNLQVAIDWAESVRLCPHEPIDFLDFQFYDVLSQVYIARGQFLDAQFLLRKLLKLATDSGAVEYEIQILIRMALVHQEQGDEVAAQKILARALALAAPEGFLRLFLNQGESMAQLLYQTALQGIQVEFCNRLLAQFPSKKPDRDLQGALIEPLSDREIEVLELIAQGFTNQEIAHKLILSLFTVKSHARNIFGKLGVRNRTEAVAKARLLGFKL